MTTIQISDRQSNFQIVKAITSNVISSLTGGVFAYGMGLMLLHDTHSPLSFALDVIIAPLMSLLFFIPIGNYVDQHHHKKIIAISYLIRLLLLGLFALTINYFSGILLLVPIVIFVMIDTVLSNLRSTAYYSAVHELVNQNKIASLSSLTQAVGAGSQILGPILGVTLYSLVSFETFIGIEFIGTLIAFCILLTMKFFVETQSEDDEQPKTPAGQFQGFKAGVAYIRQRPLIRDIVFMGAILNALDMALVVGMPFIVVNQLHYPNSTIAFIETGLSVGYLLGSLVANVFNNKGAFIYKIFGPFIIVNTLTILMGLLFFFAPGITIVKLVGMGINLLSTIAAAILNISLGVRMQKTVPTKVLGRVESLTSTICQIAMPLGALFFTGIFQWVANGALVIILEGIITTVFTLICIPIFAKNIRQDDQFIQEHEADLAPDAEEA